MTHPTLQSARCVLIEGATDAVGAARPTTGLSAPRMATAANTRPLPAFH